MWNDDGRFLLDAVITIGVEDDDVPENDENVVLALRGATGGATLEARRDAVNIVITANDFVAGQLSFTNTAYLLKEGTSICRVFESSTTDVPFQAQLQNRVAVARRSLSWIRVARKFAKSAKTNSTLQVKSWKSQLSALHRHWDASPPTGRSRQRTASPPPSDSASRQEFLSSIPGSSATPSFSRCCGTTDPK